MHADDLVIDHGTTRQAIESIAKLLPHLHGEPTTAFVIKSVYTIDPCTLMVTQQKEEILWILKLVAKQQRYYLQAAPHTDTKPTSLAQVAG